MTLVDYIVNMWSKGKMLFKGNSRQPELFSKVWLYSFYVVSSDCPVYASISSCIDLFTGVRIGIIDTRLWSYQITYGILFPNLLFSSQETSQETWYSSEKSCLFNIWSIMRCSCWSNTLASHSSLMTSVTEEKPTLSNLSSHLYQESVTQLWWKYALTKLYSFPCPGPLLAYDDHLYSVPIFYNQHLGFSSDTEDSDT